MVTSCEHFLTIYSLSDFKIYSISYLESYAPVLIDFQGCHTFCYTIGHVTFALNQPGQGVIHCDIDSTAINVILGLLHSCGGELGREGRGLRVELYVVLFMFFV